MLCVACRAKIYDLEWKRFDAHTQTNSIKLGIVTRIKLFKFSSCFFNSATLQAKQKLNVQTPTTAHCSKCGFNVYTIVSSNSTTVLEKTCHANHMCYFKITIRR